MSGWVLGVKTAIGKHRQGPGSGGSSALPSLGDRPGRPLGLVCTQASRREWLPGRGNLDAAQWAERDALAGFSKALGFWTWFRLVDDQVLDTRGQGSPGLVRGALPRRPLACGREETLRHRLFLGTPSDRSHVSHSLPKRKSKKNKLWS